MQLDEALLGTVLGASGFGSPRKVLTSTGSTNADALVWADRDAPEGALVVADQQTEGRGRQGRSWLSEPGTALLFSLVLRPPDGALPLVSTAVGVGACEALRRATRLTVHLKWPNDLLVGDRKLAGILVETRLLPERDAVAVAGLGLNVSQAELPAAVASRATSIAAEMERSGLDEPPSREALLGEMVSGIHRRYKQLVEGGVQDLVTTAESLSCLVGREVIVRIPAAEPVSGMVTGLAPDGGLELETAAGLKVLTAGEVETVRTA
jgi:BirA family biotin operon repressor/biotin-[acetyl-CoA-carboxylase] ligase